MNVTSSARRSLRALAPVAVSLPMLAAGACAALAQGEVNIYSYREPQLIDPLLKAFTDKTGIKANVVYASAGLNERLAAEGQNSPADLLLTVDAGRLSEAKDAGLTQPVDLPRAQEAVPAQFRDPADHWFGLTMRSRVVYASKERVKQDTITYEELADPKWKGKICIRSGQHVYNTSLIATMIAHKGEAFDRDVAQGREGQPGAEAGRRRPRAGARHLLGQVRPGARQHLLHGADGQEREEPRAEGVGRRDQAAVPQRRRPRQPRQHLGHGHGQARAEQGQCRSS